MALLDIAGEEAAAAELGALFGLDRVVGIRCDVTDDDSLRRSLERARSHFGSLSVVINNAGKSLEGMGLRTRGNGTSHSTEPPALHPPAGIATSMFDDMRRAVAINLTAVMRGTEIAADLDVRLIVNIASVAGLGPVAVTPVYAATKAGVVNFTRSLRWMERQRGVRVVAICPSWAATAMVKAGLESGVLQDVIAASPFGIMQPAQVAEAFTLALDNVRLAGDIIVVTGDKGVRVMRFRKDDASDAAPTEKGASGGVPQPRL